MKMYDMSDTGASVRKMNKEKMTAKKGDSLLSIEASARFMLLSA